MEQTVAEIGRRMERGVFTQHGVVNAAKIVGVRRDADLCAAILTCDIINADGMGVVLAARILGRPVPERVTGIDLFLRLVAWAAARGEPVFLLGAESGIVAKAAAALRERYPGLRLAGWHHGYFWNDEDALVERIRASGATMLFVGITSPQKERFIHRWRERLGVRFAMGVGGAFDVLAGKTRRAPRWMQRAGLEWLFRLILEPKRLWRRYIVVHALFCGILLLAWWRRPRGRPS
jgi:N-acetylglucosaminyldiphosphoundecaprenol N-acetyl-beta-D-mannosaminyltransferase